MLPEITIFPKVKCIFFSKMHFFFLNDNIVTHLLLKKKNINTDKDSTLAQKLKTTAKLRLAIRPVKHTEGSLLVLTLKSFAK